MSIYSLPIHSDEFYVASELAPRFTQVPGELLGEIIAEALAIGVLVSDASVAEKIENAVYDAEEQAQEIGREEGREEEAQEWEFAVKDAAEVLATLLDDLCAFVDEDKMDKATKVCDNITKLVKEVRP